MRVQVRLFSRFRECLPREARGRADLDLPDDTTVAEVLAHLSLADPVKLITVNGQREGNPQRALADGDVLHIFPPVVGG
jgi:molybdopterin converting factor small subunit